MFSKFLIENIEVDSFRNLNIPELINIGKGIYSDYKKKVTSSLEKYIKANGHLDANQLQGEWFPDVPADIFISHSHADEDTALALAGFLKREFDLDSFIDSTLWKNIEELQKLVDEPLRFSPNGSYNYHKRNQSTAYVHMLLSTALTKMMDNSEAIFFLSTDNSLKSQEPNITESVWIYHELFTSRFLREKTPERYSRIQKCFSGGILESRISDGFKLDFTVDLSDFKKLDSDKINSWISLYSSYFGSHPLDILYSLYQI